MTATHDDRAEALRQWREETEGGGPVGRRFSGERLRRAVTTERLAKAAFVLGTAVVLVFVFNQESKEERLRNREARAASQLDEPSVRDFRPPVMPSRLAAADRPIFIPDTPKQEEKVATPPPQDPEALAKRRKAEQLDEARTKSEIVVKAAAAGAVSVCGYPSGANEPRARAAARAASAASAA
jgi:hypothetical protein